MSEEAGFFDGELVASNLHRFLARMNTALKESQDHLPDFEVKEIWLELSVDAHGNIGFAGTELGASRSRTFNFILTPNQRKNP